ncbi:amino acid adenylation domain-containing protein [Acinetobacter calcoaceticus]|uniref:amino acid adenylation domain-containing protein n=1 Tax=Acinetobacter calcoaceticus TaxID=471 RepID=UPI0032B58B8F
MQELFKKYSKDEGLKIHSSLERLFNLENNNLDSVIKNIPGGIDNVKNIYPLGPFQEEIFIESNIAGNKTSLCFLSSIFEFESDKSYEEILNIFEFILNRHEALRTVIVSDGLPEPVQVVLKNMDLIVNNMQVLDCADAYNKLKENNVEKNLSFENIPLFSVDLIRVEKTFKYFIRLNLHKIISDYFGLEIIKNELICYLSNKIDKLQVPVSYKLHVENYLNIRGGDANSFFYSKLYDYNEYLAPFNLSNFNKINFISCSENLKKDIVDKLLNTARVKNIEPKVFFYTAWALIIAKCSNTEDVVFGSLMRSHVDENDYRKLGVYSNILPIRLKIKDINVSNLLLLIKNELSELKYFINTPSSLIYKCSGIKNSAPLYSTLLNYRQNKLDNISNSEKNCFVLNNLKTLDVEDYNYPLVLTVNDFGDNFEVEVKVDESINPQLINKYIEEVLLKLVEIIDNDIEVLASDISIIPESEKLEQVQKWNDTFFPYDKNLCLHELFESQVINNSGNIAVIFGQEKLTYFELNKKANQLAHLLINYRAIKPDTLVGICLDRSIEMVVCILAVLKAGGAYVPLDPDYPESRLNYMIEDSNLSTIITRDKTLELRGINTKNILNIQDQNILNILNQQPIINPEVDKLNLKSNHLAYVIYTSGSTGQPKGVMIEHSSIVNRIEWMNNQYGSSCDDRFLQKTPFSFDVSVWEFFWPLSTGAGLVIAKPAGHKDPHYLIELICNEKITKLHFVPSMLSSMLAIVNLADCVSLKQIFCSGEALAPNLVNELLQKCPNLELHNLYGPTEASVDVSYWHCELNTENLLSVPIGRPINNTQFFVLNNKEEIVPTGSVGELHIGGIGLARGYLNKDKLTLEKFIKNPFYNPDIKGSSKRLYKTGDLVRWLPDGILEYLGRIDEQVKIRGFRIELKEIEASLLESGLVKDVVVLAVNTTIDNKELIAYIVTDDPNFSDLEEALRAYLAQKLPEYMYPSSYIKLTALPVTPNGKLDRKALSDLSVNYKNINNLIVSDLEKKLCDIYKDVLNLESINIKENYFKRNGYPLLAVHLTSLINCNFNVNLSVRDILKASSVSELSKILIDLGTHSNIVSADIKEDKLVDKLKNIWVETLQVGNVNEDDNFFRLGGHSLSALKMLHRVKEVTGFELHITDIYQNPTLSELVKLIHGQEKKSAEYISLSEEATLSQDIQPPLGQPKNPPESILLTGATGFVGRFLLRQLLDDNEKTKIYCLIRAETPSKANERLKEIMLRYKLWRNEDENRLVAISGDISKPKFGLSNNEYIKITETIDSIFHCGTNVNHLENYKAAKAVNVDSMNDLFHLATMNRPKILNFISTLAVFNSNSHPKERVIDELHPINNENHLEENGYETSKWVAENIVKLAQDRAIRCNVYRLGLVWADSKNGYFDPKQREYRILESCIRSGYGISNYSYDMQPIPVDYVANAISILAEQNPQGGRIFHIGGSAGTTINISECLNNNSSLSLTPLSLFNWVKKIKTLHENGQSLSAVPLIQSSFSMNQLEFETSQRERNQGLLNYCWQKTQKELELSGLKIPNFNKEMIKLTMDRIVKFSDISY